VQEHDQWTRTRFGDVHPDAVGFDEAMLYLWHLLLS